ncbi:EcsC family protein [Cellulophaga baltica]|uniref:EcsC family protein n=1 Tax=Cellulophaga baltica TaxID=76594 RepID=UPI0024958C50|nr:EcsC family protein [Cellulophaga baltica]
MSKLISNPKLAENDLKILTKAKQQMEEIGWAMKGLNSVGNIIQNKVELLPQKQQKWLQEASYKTLQKVVKTNLLSMKTNKPLTTPLNNTYKALVTSSGILGGTFGIVAFSADLAVATKFMMRSIMDIARSEGEDLTELDTQLACLQVFALGGKSTHDDHLETGYYATRITLNSTIKGATSGAGKLVGGMLKGSSNPLLQILGAIASRFSIQVSEKFVAQAIPVLGAAGGGAINLAFIHHFQRMAHAHFAIRKLERTYGEELIRQSYEEITIS